MPASAEAPAAEHQEMQMEEMAPMTGPLELGARVMLSGEPLTIARRGYPLLLQTGETFHGAPIHDRQHPHDLFMELALTYARSITDDLAFELYAAPVGEPALGPVAFPHRASASADPMAPLGHHWQDSTHISFGVLSAGVFTRYLKVEGSWFNGREPDESRLDFDFHPLDSLAARVSVNPTPSLSLQASYGFLKSPEELEPDHSVRRLTASATYNVAVSDSGNWATTAVWGRNLPAATDAFLVESTLELDGVNSFYGRAELVRKEGRDLVIAGSEDEVFNGGALAVGYVRDLGTWAALTPSLGLRASLNLLEPSLTSVYGSKTPAGVMVFVRLRTARS